MIAVAVTTSNEKRETSHREMLATNRALSGKIDVLGNRLDPHDSTIQDLIEVIQELMTPDDPPRKRIGLQLPTGKAKGQLRTTVSPGSKDHPTFPMPAN
jgi:hypothetical protein